MINSAHSYSYSTVSDDGESATLLVLSGTLPISFRGAQYHIPIDVFIPQLYNDEPVGSFSGACVNA